MDGWPGSELPEGAGKGASARAPCLHERLIHRPHPAMSRQALGEPLMREVIRDHCQPVLERGQLHGEALLATFKPRGYSECIVIVGGEERQ